MPKDAMIEIIKILGNSKMKIAVWLLENMNDDRILIATQNDVAKKTGFSPSVINECFKFLMGEGLLIRLQHGVYKLTLPGEVA